MKLNLFLLCLALSALTAQLAWSAKPAAKSAAPVEPAEPEMSIEEYLQKLSTVPDVISRKDPFISSAAPFEVPKDGDTAAAMLSAPVLERYPIGAYTIVATLLGDKYPRALVKLPPNEKNKVLIVKEKDKLGQNGGVIANILKDGLRVLQSQKSPLGYIERTEVILKVGGGSETSKVDEDKKPPANK